MFGPLLWPFPLLSVTNLPGRFSLGIIVGNPAIGCFLGFVSFFFSVLFLFPRWCLWLLLSFLFGLCLVFSQLLWVRVGCWFLLFGGLSGPVCLVRCPPSVVAVSFFSGALLFVPWFLPVLFSLLFLVPFCVSSGGVAGGFFFLCRFFRFPGASALRVPPLCAFGRVLLVLLCFCGRRFFCRRLLSLRSRSCGSLVLFLSLSAVAGVFCVRFSFRCCSPCPVVAPGCCFVLSFRLSAVGFLCPVRFLAFCLCRFFCRSAGVCLSAVRFPVLAAPGSGCFFLGCCRWFFASGAGSWVFFLGSFGFFGSVGAFLMVYFQILIINHPCTAGFHSSFFGGFNMYQTNKEFAKNDCHFRSMCASVGVVPSARQAGKYRRKTGKAYSEHFCLTKI